MDLGRLIRPPKLSFRESTGLKFGILLAVLIAIGVWIATADLTPDLSRLNARMLSGPESGHYHAVVTGLGIAARERQGTLENVSTAGSVENAARLAAPGTGCEVRFALVQDGVGWPDGGKGLRFLGQLPRMESMFFLGRDADRIRDFGQLRGLKVGIGPEGSGTARVARQILEARDFRELDVQLSHHSVPEQLAQVQSGALDLGVFVIDEDSQLIDDAIRTRKLQIASFAHNDVIARRFPFAATGRIGTGQYDPIRILPPSDKHVVRIRTLVVANRCATRSDITAMMSLLSQRFPTFIRTNRESSNTSGLPMAVAAHDFLEKGGPEFADENLPWLVDVMPPSNWVHIIMGVSILFNLMGLLHRLQLWRLDANRVKAELFIPELFGPGITMDHLDTLPLTDAYRTPEARQRLDHVISLFETLEKRARRQSLSTLVPMGSEMYYRYQERLMKRWRTALERVRARLDA